MKSLHENTENTMMKMVDTSKREINHNLDAKVTALSTELQGIKSDVFRIENTVEGKLIKMQEVYKSLHFHFPQSKSRHLLNVLTFLTMAEVSTILNLSGIFVIF